MGWILNTILPRQRESFGGFIAYNQPVSSMDYIRMGHFFGTIGMTIACDRLKNQAARVLIHSDFERYVHSVHVPYCCKNQEVQQETMALTSLNFFLGMTKGQHGENPLGESRVCTELSQVCRFQSNSVI